MHTMQCGDTVQMLRYTYNHGNVVCRPGDRLVILWLQNGYAGLHTVGNVGAQIEGIPVSFFAKE